MDSFLYEEDDVDDLVDEGRLCRNYCAKCGSREIKPLTFISHSLSVDQVGLMFSRNLESAVGYMHTTNI